MNDTSPRAARPFYRFYSLYFLNPQQFIPKNSLAKLSFLYQSAIILNHFAGLNVSLPVLKNSHLEQLNSEFFA
ncbi:hypothetical protein CWC14_15530 [Pseudoalteromonas sp. S3260]|nr:hypothetical protein CWC14_15530 [Pseudoalteromonas sp. S3260]